MEKNVFEIPKTSCFRRSSALVSELISPTFTENCCMKRALKTKKIFGISISQTFTIIKAIIEARKSTGSLAACRICLGYVYVDWYLNDVFIVHMVLRSFINRWSMMIFE